MFLKLRFGVEAVLANVNFPDFDFFLTTEVPASAAFVDSSASASNIEKSKMEIMILHHRELVMTIGVFPRISTLTPELKCT